MNDKNTNVDMEKCYQCGIEMQMAHNEIVCVDIDQFVLPQPYVRILWRCKSCGVTFEQKIGPEWNGGESRGEWFGCDNCDEKIQIVV